MSIEINITIVLFNITIFSGFYKYNYSLHVLSRVRTRFLCSFSLRSFGFTYRKGVRIERNFSPKRLLFFTHSAQIIFHSVINSTHFNNLTNSYQSRKNRIVQSFWKSFHAIIRSNNHRYFVFISFIYHAMFQAFHDKEKSLKRFHFKLYGTPTRNRTKN